MKLFDLFGYLIGKRSSIEKVAHSNWSLLIGGLFVLSAAFAREYDGEDLLQEPWYLLIPLAASLGTSLMLYGLLYLAMLRHATSAEKPLATYYSFLSLYWMTAPLAWIYAIPVEQFTTPPIATQINLSLLGIVALWRVLLISRAASVLFGASFWSIFPLVMLFGDVLALVILWYTPLPVFSIMGGIRLTESEAIIRNTAFWIGTAGGITLPVWLLSSLYVLGSMKRNWQISKSNAQPVAPGVWTVAIFSVLVWFVVLPYTQPPLHLAWKVENALKNGKIEKAIELMSENERDSFPAHWDPPPWPGYRQDDPRLLDVIDVINRSPTKQWVRVIYVEKLLQKIGGNGMAFYSFRNLEQQDLVRLLKLLDRTPETHVAIRNDISSFKRLTENNSSSDEVKQLAQKLLKSVGAELEEK